MSPVIFQKLSNFFVYFVYLYICILKEDKGSHYRGCPPCNSNLPQSRPGTNLIFILFPPPFFVPSLDLTPLTTSPPDVLQATLFRAPVCPLKRARRFYCPESHTGVVQLLCRVPLDQSLTFLFELAQRHHAELSRAVDRLGTND